MCFHINDGSPSRDWSLRSHLLRPSQTHMSPIVPHFNRLFTYACLFARLACCFLGLGFHSCVSFCFPLRSSPEGSSVDDSPLSESLISRVWARMRWAFRSTPSGRSCKSASRVCISFSCGVLYQLVQEEEKGWTQDARAGFLRAQDRAVLSGLAERKTTSPTQDDTRHRQMESQAAKARSRRNRKQSTRSVTTGGVFISIRP